MGKYIMKKSLLALAVVAAVATSANAATVYDKDGTSLAVWRSCSVCCLQW